MKVMVQPGVWSQGRSRTLQSLRSNSSGTSSKPAILLQHRRAIPPNPATLCLLDAALQKNDPQSTAGIEEVNALRLSHP
jgi:hypothetical protein